MIGSAPLSANQCRLDPIYTASGPVPPNDFTLTDISAMRIFQLLSMLSASLLATATAQAQFSVSSSDGPHNVPASGSGGGTWPEGTPGGNEGFMPSAPGVSTLTSTQEVGSITSIEIHDLVHGFGGDVQVTLTDPNLVEHNLFLRPGYNNPVGNSFGTPGSFTGNPGTYVIVVSGGMSFPTLANGVDIPPGTYNQTFDTGGFVWQSGDNGIMNTALSGISGVPGDWTLRIYDWAVGDSGTFSGWTMNALEPGVVLEPGNPYCFGDGTGTACPCAAPGNAGEGCANTSGAGGAKLLATGTAQISADTFQLEVTGVPGNKPGLILRGLNQLNGGLGNPLGDGLICAGGQSARSQVQVTSAGNTIFTDFQGAPFGSSSFGTGTPTNYQFWYRDTGNTCSGSGFNFSNAWTVTWLP